LRRVLRAGSTAIATTFMIPINAPVLPRRTRLIMEPALPAEMTMSAATVPAPEDCPALTDYSALWKWQHLRKHPPASHGPLASAWARSVLEAHHDWLFVDTETTGLSRSDQVIEIAIAAPVQQLGRWRLEPVLVQRMRPSVRIDPGASMVHGIYERHLRDSPAFEELAPRIREVMHGRHLLAWNAPFDRAALRRTVDSWQTCTVAEDHHWYCAMRAHAVWAGDSSGPMLYRYHKLGGDHSAMGDVQVMLDRIVAMAECTP
jgi:hypothetical protein